MPAAVTEKVAVWPATTLWFAGCAEIVGAVGVVEPAGGVDVLTPLQLAKMRLTVRRNEVCASRCVPMACLPGEEVTGIHHASGLAFWGGGIEVTIVGDCGSLGSADGWPPGRCHGLRGYSLAL